MIIILLICSEIDCEMHIQIKHANAEFFVICH